MSETLNIWVTVETEEEVKETPISGERDGTIDVGGGWGAEKVTEAVKYVTKRKRVPLDAKFLKEQMTGLLSVVGELFEQASQQPKMNLDELQLSVEIDSEGQVNLVGNGGKLRNSGGISMKFTAK